MYILFRYVHTIHIINTNTLLLHKHITHCNHDNYSPIYGLHYTYIYYCTRISSIVLTNNITYIYIYITCGRHNMLIKQEFVRYHY